MCEESERKVTLEPGQEYCPGCSKVVDFDQRRQCAACGHEGCPNCLQRVDDTGDDDLDVTYACGPKCELEYLESLARYEERSHRKYQDWVGRKIEEARKQVAA